MSLTRDSVIRRAMTALLLPGLPWSSRGRSRLSWAYGLKHADGFTRFWPSVGTIAAIGLSFAFMAVALRSIPFGTAYAVWCGIGVAGP